MCSRAHNLHSSQMLTGLRLRARLVCSNQQQRAIHDSSSIEHGSHENVMPCSCTHNQRHSLRPCLLAHLYGTAVVNLQWPGSDRCTLKR